MCAEQTFESRAIDAAQSYRSEMLVYLKNKLILRDRAVVCVCRFRVVIIVCVVQVLFGIDKLTQI